MAQIHLIHLQRKNTKSECIFHLSRNQNKEPQGGTIEPISVVTAILLSIHGTCNYTI